MSRRPILGWIAFAFLVLALAAAGGILAFASTETADAFLPGPPWWALATTWGVLPVGALAGLALLTGIVGAARREKPGWPAITAMILSIPVLGAVAVSSYLWFLVVTSCAGPSGACG